MQIAVCDDEKVYLDLYLNQIKRLIAMQDKNYEVIIDCYSSGEELITAYDAGKEYDIIILDIKMKDLSGFDVAKIIRQYNDDTLIIFITSLKDYIYNSFEYQPFWFLIKPVTNERFKHVIMKAVAYIIGTKGKNHSFYTRDAGIISLEINKIMYLESCLRKINIYTNTQSFSYYATLKEEEQKLKNHNFVRSHKAYLVNMAYIKRINKGSIILKNNKSIPLSERRRKAVFDSFTSFLERC
ncbi:MAG: response regulator transcription factor [Clostridiaceae bacterium]|jgi:DNA-binding LytR/AlgR family response regulator|nr:response regulator transcription factor [Clostridiaceae bacterium]